MLTARLKFLDASAHHYSTLAPATSAHLMLERMTVAANNEIAPPKGTDSNAACGACGTIRIPGWTSRTTIVDLAKPKGVPLKSKKKRRSGGIGKRPEEKHVVVQCLTCHRQSTTRLQTSQGHRDSRQGSSNAAGTASTESVEPATVTNPAQVSSKPVSVNNSSKKRAKNRKQGGLQAMLEKSKGTGSSSGFGLELMDLLKQT